MKIEKEIDENKIFIWRNMFRFIILFSCIMLFTLQYLTSQVNLLRSTTLDTETQEHITLENKLKEETFTILISTYDRDNKLFDRIYKYLHIPYVEEIYIVWFDIKRKVPEAFEVFLDPKNFPNITKLPKLNFLHFEKHLLSNRLRQPPGGFKTRGVFSVDDDLKIDNNLITKGFELWKKGGSNRVVGYEPRMFDLSEEGQGYKWDKSCFNCLFNTVWVTKGAFIDQKYYTEVWNKEYSSVMNLVEKYRTGEDMLMSYVLSASNYFNEKVELYVLQKYLGFPEFEIPEYSLKVNTTRNIFRKKAKPPSLSLGETTSQHRPLIRQALQELSQKKFGLSSGPFETVDQWKFVDVNMNFFEQENLCQSDLKQLLVCSN
eukprot:snap_masked-scaffold_30-processed-gene-0.11-mRNA-1 protein AED:1.00 eAED:1.00 QI:0/-1/0/0/-1/1/1/0/373